MKICVVNFNFYCLFNPLSDAPMGGAELDMYTVALALRRWYEVCAVTANWRQDIVERRDGVTIFRSFSMTRSFLNIFFAPIIFFKTLKLANADVYITSGAGPEVGMIALFCKIYKKKFIYRTASSMDCDGSYIEKNNLLGKIYEYGLRRAVLIVTSVKQHQQLLTDRYPSLKNKIDHIRLGITIQTKQIQKEGILWVSRCERLKKPEVFLQIAKEIPDLKFTLICPRQKHDISYFEIIKNEALVLKNVKFIEFVPFKDIQVYFDTAKICVNTSDFEGFTYTLIQSGLAGTPVVYLSVNPDNVITEYNIGYVANNDVNVMISQIRTLLANKDDWKKKSENIKKYVRENHQIVTIGQEWNALLKKL